MNLVNKKVILLSTIIILLMTLIILLQKDNKRTIYTDKQNVVDPNWQTYHNEELGVEIKYPEKYYVWNYDCTQSNKQARSSFTLIPTQVLAKEGVFYIAPAYMYEEKNGVCSKIDVNAEMLNSDTLLSAGSMKIVIKNNIFNDQDLNKVVKEFYGGAGEDCHINEKKMSTQDGVYDIFVISDGLEIDASRCWVDYQTYLKYYPKEHKIMFTDLGMEYRFWANASGTVTFDQAMIDSFKFID